MMDSCAKCKYYPDCPGIPRARSARGLLTEVMLEVEPRCNFDCRFCFNRYSFARQGRTVKSLTAGKIKNIIDHIAAFGVRSVRFTGGEPLLRKDLFSLMAYARKKKLEVRLNTNGSLLDRHAAGRLGGLADNVLIPVESASDRRESALTGAKNALLKKISALIALRKAGVPVLRVGTVATKDNVDNFAKLAALMLNLPIDEWEFYRPVADGKDARAWSARTIMRLAENIEEFRRKTRIRMLVANAVPFCAISKSEDLCRVSAGALFEDGHSRLVADPRGFLKPHYFIDKKLALAPDIEAAWEHPFMRQMRNLEFLPRMCRDCRFKEKCRGGSRFAAKMRYGDWRAPDPLAKTVRKSTAKMRKT